MSRSELLSPHGICPYCSGALDDPDVSTCPRCVAVVDSLLLRAGAEGDRLDSELGAYDTGMAAPPASEPGSVP